MTYTFSPELDSLVQDEMARGNYASVDELLMTAIHSLRDRAEAIEGIGEGIADLDAGRTRPAHEVFRDLRERYGISAGT
jgi:hypothetical protein